MTDLAAECDQDGGEADQEAGGHEHQLQQDQSVTPAAAHSPDNTLESRDNQRTSSASKRSIRRFIITEKAPTRAFSWLKAATTAFTFKTLLRHYAKRTLTPRSLNVKLGPQSNYHKGQAAIRHYANQPARPFN